MKIRVTFDFGPDERRAIAASCGRDGLANRETCLTWLVGTVQADLESIYGDVHEHDAAEAES